MRGTAPIPPMTKKLRIRILRAQAVMDTSTLGCLEVHSQAVYFYSREGLATALSGTYLAARRWRLRHPEWRSPVALLDGTEG